MRSFASKPSAPSGFDLLITKLRQWRATNDPIALARIEKEINALLANTDDEDFVRRLPAEFQETPFAFHALERWAKRDPAAVLDWLGEGSRPAASQAGMVVRQWLAGGMSGLRAYLDDLPDGAWKQQVLKEAVAGALDKGMPRDAADWLAQLDPAAFSPELLDWTAQVWAKKNFAEAAAWADEQEDPVVRDRLLANLAVGRAASDPAGAIEFARAHLQAPEASAAAVTGILSIWTADHPEEAAKWVAAFPPGESRASALQTLISVWAQRQPADAQHWAASQLAGNDRERGLQQIAMSESVSDFPTAAESVAQLSPGQVQNDLGSGIIRRWGIEDFSRASAWVDRLPPGDFRQLASRELAKARSEPRDY